MDEVLADPALAPWPEVEPVFLRQTGDGSSPIQATWLKAAWDSDELRLFYWVEDDCIRATHTERDALLYEEEVVEIFLDPSGNPGEPEAYFEIEVNPLNAVLDLELRRSSTGLLRDWSWKCEGLRTAVSRHDRGWCAEMSVPFAGIGPTPPRRQWRANFFRIDRPLDRPRELSAWSPTGAPDFHIPARFGYLEFLE